MADIFISFATTDVARVQPLVEALRSRQFTVFWSRDIPIGTPNYQTVIKQEIRRARAIIVAWTQASVESEPVAQECSHAALHKKLIQIFLDVIDPIDLPFEAGYKGQKAMLLGWAGDTQDPEWLRLVTSLVERVREKSALTEPVERAELDYDLAMEKLAREQGAHIVVSRRDEQFLIYRASPKPGSINLAPNRASFMEALDHAVRVVALGPPRISTPKIVCVGISKRVLEQTIDQLSARSPARRHGDPTTDHSTS